MARLALLFALLLSACSLDELAHARYSGSHASAQFENRIVASECSAEASRRPLYIRASSAELEQAYLTACMREKLIMRAYGRRDDWR